MGILEQMLKVLREILQVGTKTLDVAQQTLESSLRIEQLLQTPSGLPKPTSMKVTYDRTVAGKPAAN